MVQQRDDIEDDELQVHQRIEGMPTSVSGFKDHPIYVLERHLKRDEVIHPKVEIGKFRGEPVYSRTYVLTLKTAENWMRQGRNLRVGAQPLKMVKHRAVTVHRKREVEMIQATTDEEAMQGLYSFAQTELYHPPPVVDGKVPKNDFGNIDLYVPSMLPKGAVHIPHKGTVKIARQLGFDYAEAVTGFEFKKRRALPVITGVVVAEENEEALLEAYWESVAESEEKEKAKRRERVLMRWTRLVQGLRIRQRLQEQYAPGAEAQVINLHDEEPVQEGGFVAGLDDAIAPFSLPRMQHQVVEFAQFKRTAAPVDDEPLEEVIPQPAAATLEDDVEMVDVTPDVVQSGAPKTLAELAAEHDEAKEAQATDPKPLNGSNYHRAAQQPSKTRQVVLSSAEPVLPAGPKGRVQPARGTKRSRKQSLSSASETENESDAVAVSRTTRSVRVPVAGGRTLRARVPKSEAAVRQEKDLEAAYRRAIAE